MPTLESLPPSRPAASGAPVGAPDVVRPAAPRDAGGDLGNDAWGALLGGRARAWLALGAVLVFAAGAAAPLGDPDFGMHLRIGEWIAAHGRVPRVEPFAWTRAGAPFYAYSWAADLAYYGVGRAGGAAALRALQGALVLAGAGAAWGYARALALPRAGTLLLVLIHVLVVAACVPQLRPQGVLAVVVPLAWAAGARLGAPNAEGRGAGRRWPDRWLDVWPYAALLGAAAVAANTHLLAPVVAAALAPLVGRAVEARDGRRRLAAAAVCVGVGLLLTPYVAEWGAVLRLNFAPNALFRYPSPIAEHTPGAVALLRPPQPAAGIVVALLLLPWVVPAAPDAPEPDARVERVLYVVLWLAGALLFALALRGLFVWWLLALPLAARALARVPAPTGSGVGRLTWRLAVVGVPLTILSAGVGASWRWRALEDPFGRRVFATEGAGAAFAAADTLDRRAPGAVGRVLTTFNYGNALLWRLPRLSMSVDGRTIFPDSAAAAEAFRLASDSSVVPTVVGSADLAVLPARHAVAVRLARLGGWRRVAVVPMIAPGGAADTAVVWATDRWAGQWLRGEPMRARR